MKESKGNRITLYDWMRLIGTILVVVGHSAYLSITTSGGGVNYQLPPTVSSSYGSFLLNALRWLAGFAYTFHMPLFFFLSGAVLGLRPIPKFDSFLKGKIKRLLVPYFLYSWLFMLPVKYLGGFYDKASLERAMQGVLTGVDSGHLWFLTSLFWCMVTFVIVYKIITRFTKSLYALLLCSGIIYFAYSYLPFDILGLKQGLSYIHWFALGYVFENERAAGKFDNHIKVLGVLVCAIIIRAASVNYAILNSFYLIVVGCSIVICLSILFSKYLNGITETRVWKVVIRNLFYVYIFHDPLEYVILKIAFSCDMLSSGVGCYVYFGLRTLGVFFASILLGELIRRLRNIADKAEGGNKAAMAVVLSVIILITAGMTAIFRYDDGKFYVSSLTDANWTNGVLNSNTSMILFEYDEDLLKKLIESEHIKTDNQVFEIVNVDNDSGWIRVTVDRDAIACMYPAKIEIEK